jgi:hypothetical protein
MLHASPFNAQVASYRPDKNGGRLVLALPKASIARHAIEACHVPCGRRPVPGRCSVWARWTVENLRPDERFVEGTMIMVLMLVTLQGAAVKCHLQSS